MSTSRITLGSSRRPSLAQHPALPTRVVTQLVGLCPMALDREVSEQVRTFAPRPLARDLFHPDHSPLPAKPQGPDSALEEDGEDVHGLVERLEHGCAPLPLETHHSAHTCRAEGKKRATPSTRYHD